MPFFPLGSKLSNVVYRFLRKLYPTMLVLGLHNIQAGVDPSVDSRACTNFIQKQQVLQPPKQTGPALAMMLQGCLSVQLVHHSEMCYKKVPE